MTGPVEWTQIIFIVGLALTGVVVGFLGAWRLLSYLLQQRGEFERQISEKRAAFEVRVNMLEDRMEKRFTAIEVFNAGTMVVLEHMKEFREEIKEQFQSLRDQRGKDMEGLNRRLDALHNAARLERIVHEDLSKKED
jgi:hypothetical protein